MPTSTRSQVPALSHPTDLVFPILDAHRAARSSKHAPANTHDGGHRIGRLVRRQRVISSRLAFLRLERS
jgi:hypothetical protein